MSGEVKVVDMQIKTDYVVDTTWRMFPSRWILPEKGGEACPLFFAGPRPCIFSLALVRVMSTGTLTPKNTHLLSF